MLTQNFPESLQGLDVLIIDDDENSLDVASIVLEFAGANVSLASHGKDGLDSINSKRPQFILCDLSMPVMDGWEFIRQLRNDENHRDLKVIALTAHAMVGDQEKALSAGFNGYLTKPLEPATFVNQLLRVLDKAGIQLTLLATEK